MTSLALQATLNALDAQMKKKNDAYTERNMCVAFMAKMALALGWGVTLTTHDETDLSWDREWLTIVNFDTPAGQLSWHLHDDHVKYFQGIRYLHHDWDGHTTEEKYKRMENWKP